MPQKIAWFGKKKPFFEGKKPFELSGDHCSERRVLSHKLDNRQFKHQTLTQTQTVITFEFSLPNFEMLIYVALKY